MDMCRSQPFPPCANRECACRSLNRILGVHFLLMMKNRRSSRDARPCGVLLVLPICLVISIVMVTSLPSTIFDHNCEIVHVARDYFRKAPEHIFKVGGLAGLPPFTLFEGSGIGLGRQRLSPQRSLPHCLIPVFPVRSAS